MRRGRVYIIGIAFVLVLPGVYAQPSSPTFRTSARLVSTPITVTDSKGGLAEGCPIDDLRLYDNDQLRQISIEEGGGPIALAVVVQADFASGKSLEAIKSMAPMFSPLIAGEGGAVAILSFHFDVHVEQPFAAKAEEPGKAIEGLSAGGTGSALLDAASVAIDMLVAQPTQRRRVILLLTEGHDRSSKTKLDEVLLKAQGADVTVYSLLYSSFLAQFSGKRYEIP